VQNQTELQRAVAVRAVEASTRATGAATAYGDARASLTGLAAAVAAGPAALAGTGLVTAALVGLAGALRSGIRAAAHLAGGAFDVPEELPPLGAATEVAAYRIVQESLTNSIRHAGPATATVKISYRPHGIELQISDTGRGLVSTSATHGHGLIGMRERAAAVGGVLDVGPRGGGGFQVIARLPLEVAR